MERVANIHDVSKKAGVSVSTVSRVFNDSANVKQELKDRVNAAIAELNYTPNQSARFLKTKESKTVYYLAPEIKNPYFISIYSGIQMKLEEHGYMTFFYQPTSPLETLKKLKEKGADGIIIDSLYAQEAETVLKPANIPYTICNSPAQLSYSNSIYIDLYSINYKLFSTLFEMGHKKVGIITYQISKDHKFDRMHAYEQACKDHNISYIKSLISFQDLLMSKYEGGYAGFNDLIQNHPDLTAVACVNDLVCIGAMSAAKELNYKIPDDISFVGFDNDEISQFTTPSLSTVNLPKEKQGELAADMLLKLILEPQAGSYSICLDPNLVLRNSIKEIK